MTTVSLAPRASFNWSAFAGVAALIVVLVGALAFVTGFTLKPYSFHGMVLQSPDRAFDFELLGHQGQTVSLSDFRGQAVLVFFGYSSCPDICPTTLATLADARRKLGRLDDEVQVIMVTVDPEVDTLERLGEYMEHFDRDFLGLTGTEEELRQAATYFGVYFDHGEHAPADESKGDAPAAGSMEGMSADAMSSDHGAHQPEPRLVAHTSTTLLIDRDGYARLIFPYGASAEDIAEDLEYVLEH